MSAQWSEAEFIQYFMRRWLNEKVRKFFRSSDVDSLDLNQPDRAALRFCLHNDNDTLLITLFRFLFFRFVILEENELQDFFLVPREEYDYSVTYVPQLLFYFEETVTSFDKVPEVERNGKRVSERKLGRTQVSFRLPDLKDDDLLADANNNPYIRELAREVKTQFKDFRFEKGIYRCSYFDKKNGRRFIIRYRYESQVKELIRRILACVDDTPDFEQFFKADPRDNTSDGIYNLNGKVKPKYRDKKRIFGDLIPTKQNLVADAEMQLKHAHFQLEGVDPVLLVSRFKANSPIFSLH
ncbi:MAG: hypothetical protein ACPGVO_04405 [Spirulinaceae cyanobacterium]